MGLPKYKRTRWHDDDALLCFGLVRLFIGKLFARWVYQNTNARDDTTTMRWFVSDWCVCILVKYLQDGFTQIQTHAMTRRRCVALFRIGAFARLVYQNTNARDDTTTMRCFVSDWCVCFLVKYLPDGFTKIQTHAMTRRRCVALFRIGAFVSW